MIAMKLKHWKIFDTFLLFGMTFLLHFLYDWFPNPFSAIFSPVNESIWEHMKLLASAFFLNCILEFLVFYFLKWNYKNLFLGSFLAAFFSIPVYLLFYLPIHYLFGHFMWYAILLLFLVFALFNYILYRFLERKEYKNGNIYALIGFILLFTIFGYLTYRPIKIDLFFDHEDNRYSINQYVIKQ